MESLTRRLTQARWLAVALASLSALACDPGRVGVGADTDADGVADDLDCAPTDPHAGIESVVYVDADGDGFTVGDSFVRCGTARIPPGFTLTSSGEDCDDTTSEHQVAVRTFPDPDGDGVGTGDAVVVCASSAFAPVTRTGDCDPTDSASFQRLDYAFRDADMDGAMAPEVGTICTGATLPEGFSGLPGRLDCDDHDGSVSFTVLAYLDCDGDGVGAGPPVEQCTGGGIYPGYAHTGDDCAPMDFARWRVLPYTHRDADQDGRTVPEDGTICTGYGLPTGYLASAGADDCDDHDPAKLGTTTLYPDTDGDGYGAGVPRAMCVAQSPVGYAYSGADCDPDDARRYQDLSYSYRDRDGDGFTVSTITGTVCSGAALPAGYLAAPGGDDCDDTSAARHAALDAYADEDRDGVGAGSLWPLCTDGAIPAGYAATNGDCAPTDPARKMEVPYAFVDRDGDGSGVPEAGLLCTASGVLAGPYRASNTVLDCDDADATRTRHQALFPDLDGDGAGAGAYTMRCIGASIPAGLSLFGDDEDDRDRTKGPDPDLVADVLLPVLL